MNLLVFGASHRPASRNRALARLSGDWLGAHARTVDFAEYSELDMPLYNAAIAESGPAPEAVQQVAERFARADAVVISAPEYNWSIPGSLKNMIDWLSYLTPCPLASKSALLMCATPSKRGGAVGLSHLKTSLECVGMFVYPAVFTCGEASAMLNESGFKQPKMRDQFDELHKNFIDYASRLQRHAA
ncbi:MAG: NAD(P)H-dependent oxidoreductase [Rickettsiales bacterium]|nr:NAD(P)H-dependent oxidoreductase [Rickettsiales bacterium]